MPLYQFQHSVTHFVHLGAILMVKWPEPFCLRLGQLQRFGDGFLPVGGDDTSHHVDGSLFVGRRGQRLGARQVT